MKDWLLKSKFCVKSAYDNSEILEAPVLIAVELHTLLFPKLMRLLVGYLKMLSLPFVSCL
jgi:hypothetical protein